MWCGHGDRLPAGACLPGHNDEVFRSGTPFVTVDGGEGEGGPTDGPVLAGFATRRPLGAGTEPCPNIRCTGDHCR